MDKTSYLWVNWPWQTWIGQWWEASPNSKKKIGEPTEEKNKALKEWRRDDNNVCSWLVTTMEPSISEIMPYQNSAQAMWEKAEKFCTYLSVTVRDLIAQAIWWIANFKRKKRRLRCTDIQFQIQKKIQLREQQDDIFQFLAILFFKLWDC
jgi:hypothetical protein